MNENSQTSKKQEEIARKPKIILNSPKLRQDGESHPVIEKDYKDENINRTMGLLGAGRGIFGLRKSMNWIFYLDLILLVFGIYEFIIGEIILSLGTIGIFLVVLSFLSLSSQKRKK